MNYIEAEIEICEEHIQGYINDSIRMMGYEFFGDNYPWEEEKEVKALRDKIEQLRRSK